MDLQGVQVQGTYNEIEELKLQEESRQRRVNKAKEELQAAELELDNLPVFEHPKDKIVGLTFLVLKVVSGRTHIRQKLLQKLFYILSRLKKLVIPWCYLLNKRKLIFSRHITQTFISVF